MTQCLSTKEILCSSLVALSLVGGCSKDNFVAVEERHFGVQGKVTDSLGNPIEGAGIYCLFYQFYVPELNLEEETTFQLLDEGTLFDFKLYQNFPNPFPHSTFIRFSLPQECKTELTIRSKRSNTIVFTERDTLLPGLYQRYLEDIVMNQQIPNAVYRYSLTADGRDGTRYFDEKEMLVISDTGKPNSGSSAGGLYLFEYEDAFVGDSVRVSYSGDETRIYSVALSNSVNLLIRKEGYQDRITAVELYPTLLLNRDVVLLKGNGP